MRIGVQLYSLRSSFGSNLWGTFDRLAEAGFKHVELAGLYGLEPAALAAGLRERGLSVCSAHVNLAAMESNLDKEIAAGKELGYSTIVVPIVNAGQFAGGWAEIGSRVKAASESAAASGFLVGYHNHAFEFEPDGERTAYETFWAHAGERVICELDYYWVAKARRNPLEWIERMKSKLRLAHFKDINPQTGGFEVVGNGMIDWDLAIAASKDAGVEFAIIEHDQPPSDPVDCVVESRKFLLDKGLVD
ncbi:sugar phosphate isomerase/epimerase [Kamptonema cortianum]|nr:sugar phosphate isomerase/epimerase [Geitlerinema splendidum]MDK3155864.1 sugar phosphate isomerase/epimerase [Kamptonema cortianum]